MICSKDVIDFPFVVESFLPSSIEKDIIISHPLFAVQILDQKAKIDSPPALVHMSSP